MNTEVSLRASIIREPIVVRALLANQSHTTQVSRRLAKKLGLHSLRDVYVTDSLGLFKGSLKWKISLHPIVIKVKALDTCKTRVVYPIINYNKDDAYWEMIIGKDISNDWPDLLDLVLASDRVDRGKKPTPGPGYSEDMLFIGHNIRLISKFSDFSTPINDFFEFLCFDSEAINRLAINKVAKQMVVVYHDSTTVYKYDGVPDIISDRIESGESKGHVVSEVKARCASEVIRNFPRTVLLINGQF